LKKHCLFILFVLLNLLAFAQAPKADFSAQQVSGCSPLIVNFQDLSTNSPTSWQWDFGNGSTSTRQSPSAFYFTSGTYTVKLIATNSSGSDTLVRTAYITVYGKPKIDFTVPNRNGCYPFPVTFTDASVASEGTTNVSWQWDLGNGVQSSEQSPKTLYTTPGDYTVSLRVTNDKGCFATLSRGAYIRIPNGLKLSFDNTQVNRCQTPFPITFSSTSTGPGALSYSWDFGDGTTSTQQKPTHDYTTPGKYSVSLVVTSNIGCTDTIRKPNLISIQNIVTSFRSVDNSCISAAVSFTNTSSPAPQRSRWTLGDGTSATTLNTTKTYTKVGSYTVQLYNTYSYCTDSFSKTIEVNPRPKAGFKADGISQCNVPAPVNFTDTSTNAVGWQWDFGDGGTSTQKDPVHIYTARGNYTVTLTVRNSFGCTDVIKKTSYVQIRKPQATFPGFPKNGCIPYTTKLSASISTLDNVTSYLWTLGDGTTSTQATPTHAYPDQGSYPISLTITTSRGCTETFSLDSAIVVGRKPITNFTATPNPVCAYQDVFFSGTTNEGDKWDWNFGDGITSNLQNPVHAYKDTGLFTIIMGVTNSGCRVNLSKPAFLQVKPPIAKFGIEKTCGRANQLHFIDSSIGAKTWFWNFGDSTTSTEQSPVHVFKQNGTYTVTLTVSNDTCSHTDTSTVSIFEVNPSIQVSTKEACKPAIINFSAQTLNPADVIFYEWQFSNGSSSTSLTPQVTYTKAGNYSTRLITTDIYGCKDTISENNHIRINGPTAKFTNSKPVGCKGLTVFFRDTSVTDGLHPIKGWSWQYGDGQGETLSSSTPVQHLYADTGSYNVQLTVVDKAGCSDSMRVAKLVTTTAPKALFVSPDTLTCFGSTVTFTNQTTSANYTSKWSFGDSTFSSQKNPTHVYRDTGFYQVSLKITDIYGCSDSIKAPNYISVNKTAAAFTASDTIGGCTPFKVAFKNQSSFAASSYWRIGRDSSKLTNPSYSFSLEGSYPITLIVKGRGGCVDSAKRTVVIYDESATKFSYTPLAGCTPVLITASVTSPVNMTYNWDFGDGQLAVTKNPDTSHLFTNFGDFVPRLIVTDSGNCLVPIIGEDTIHVNGITTKFGWDKSLFCDSGSVQFLDSSRFSEPTVFTWTFGDNKTSNLESPLHTYQQPGLYTVGLLAETASGCKDSTSFPDLVKVSQTPLIAIRGDSVVCADAPLLSTGEYLRRDTSAMHWYWEFPNGATATVIKPPAQRYTTPGDFEIKAIAMNSSGCADTVTQAIRVNALPAATLPDTLTGTVGMPVMIQPATYSPNVVSYLWSPAEGLSCTTCPQPAAKPNFNTTYRVTVTDGNGCRNSAEVRVIVFCHNSNVFVPNTFSPNGDGSNDVFYVRGTGVARVKSLRIFNRFGEVVFERQNFAVNDASAGWDGTFKGRKLAPDTYIYQLDAFCENNVTVRFDGSITLIR
jgi:gliding motility-associated-like protein